MPHVLVLYNAPADPAHFDRYYVDVHTPIARKIPGLRALHVSQGPVNALAGTAPYLVARLEFDSMEALNAGLNSPEGEASGADLANFASGGATLLVVQSADVLHP